MSSQRFQPQIQSDQLHKKNIIDNAYSQANHTINLFKI